MTTTVSSIIMRRVRAIHILRSFAGHALILGSIAAIALFGIAHDVWVAHVLENMPSVLHVRTFIAFFFHAFLGTEFMVQIYVTLVVLACLALLREGIRLVAALVPFPRLFVA